MVRAAASSGKLGHAMSYLIIAVAAVLGSGLTMYSGFGLGTLLLPVFAIFVPMDLAVAATAIVHACNNILKVGLLGKYASWRIVGRFGIPALVAALVGAMVLRWASSLPTLARYSIGAVNAEMAPVKLVVGVLILAFAMVEWLPVRRRPIFERRSLVVGGILSGFFGGLSGHQGALRAPYLTRLQLTPQAYVGTNAVIALMVDLVRLVIYGTMIAQATMLSQQHGEQAQLIGVGVIAALSGVLVGRRFLHHVTMRSIQYLTGGLLFIIGLLLIGGII